MRRTYYRGDIYSADLGRGIGSEQHGRRPVVIIQNNTGNRFSPTVIVAAISSKTGIKAKLPTHYFLDKVDGLDEPSVVLLEQLCTMDKHRLSTYIGHLNAEHMRGMDLALAISVGIKKPKKKKISKMELCLCGACANNFSNAGYELLCIGSQHTKREICSYCNTRMGLYYEIIQRNRRER